ncbi:MAG: hypothetical protein KC931_11430 [Candidatus Omnitrophica bacterium]|nr:hypothetical protein [Candidatus Omnitrophota bacterium]
MSEMDLKPMSIGGILDGVLRLYKSHFLTFITIGLVAYVPYSALVYFMQASSGGATGAAAGTAAAIAGLMTFLYAIVVLPLCNAAMIEKISATYLDHPMSAPGAYKKGIRKIVKLLLTSICMGLVVMVGFLLLIVPGIIFSLWFILATSVVVLEPVGPIDALKRSKALMKGNLSKGFVLLFLVTVLSAIVGAAFGIVFGLILGEEFFQGIGGVIFESVVNVLILPFSTGAVVLLYYDMRIRKEAFDLEQLASDFTEATV